MSEYLTVSHSVAGLTLTVDTDCQAPCRIEWGDGSTSINIAAGTSSTPHTYARDGNYKVRVYGGGLSHSFSVVMGSPMPAWDAANVSDHRMDSIQDAAAIGATTSVLG
jgi:hypothetical protein